MINIFLVIMCFVCLLDMLTLQNKLHLHKLYGVSSHHSTGLFVADLQPYVLPAATFCSNPDLTFVCQRKNLK